MGTYNYDIVDRLTGITWVGSGENFSENIVYDPQIDSITQI